MSLLIVEGPDASGKTTLITQIMNAYMISPEVPRPAVLEHHGAYLGERAIAHHYLNSISRGLTLTDRLTIMDRSWIAEPIYGAVMRNCENRISSNEDIMLREAARNAGAKLILCLPPFEACEEKWAARIATEYPKKRDQLQRIWNYYNVFLDMLSDEGSYCGIPFMHYDYTQGYAQMVAVSKFIPK